MSPDLSAIASTAVELLHARLAGEGAEPREVAVGDRLVPRESTLGRA